MFFEWDERKWLVNLEKHKIDFRDAVQIWAGYVFEKPLIAILAKFDSSLMVLWTTASLPSFTHGAVKRGG